jgi:hypothetical protein
MSRCIAAGFDNLLSSRLRPLLVNIHDPHRCAFLRKSLRDGTSDAARRTCHHGDFAVEP